MAGILGSIAGQVRLDVRQAVASYAALRAANARTLYALRSGGAVFSAVGKASLAGGLLIAAGFAKAISSAAEFERRLDFFGAVSGATQKQMAAVSQEALRLGRTTIYSANTIADSFVELGKAGVSAGQILDGIGQAVTNLGAAADIPLTSAVDIMLAAVHTFSLNAKDAVHVADLLAGAANASTLEVEDLGVSLKYAGGVAAGFKIPIDDVITSLSILGKAGIRGSTAGTSLRQIFIGLSGPTKNAVDALKDLGIVTKDGANHFFDAAGKLKPFPKVLDILRAKTKGLTDQQKLLALKDVFNTRALPSILALLKSGSKGFAEMQKQIGKTTALDVAHKRLDNLSGDLKILRGNLETLFISSGSQFQAALRPLVQQLTDMVKWFSKLSPATQKNIFTIAAITGASLLAVGAFSLLIAGVMGAIGVFIRLGVNLRVAGKFLVSTLRTLKLLGAGFAITPLGAAVVGILTFAAALVILYKRSETARNLMNQVWSAIQSGFAAAVGYFQSLQPQLASFWASIVSAWQSGSQTVVGVIHTIVGVFEDVWPSIVSAWQSGSQAVMGVIHTVVGALKTFWDSLGGASGIAGTVGGALSTAFAGLSSAFQTVLPYAQEFWSALQKIGSAFVDFLLPVLKVVAGTFQSAFGDLVGELSGLWNQLVGTFQQVGAQLMSSLVPALANLWDSVQQLLPALKVLGIILGVAFLGAIVAVAALIPLVVLVAAKLLALAGPVLGLFISALTTAINVVGQIASAIIGVFGGAIEIIAGLIHVIVGLMTGDWAQAWRGAQEIVRGIWGVITSIIGGAVGVVWAIVSGFVEGIIGFFKHLFDVLVGHSIIPDLVNAIVRWFAGLPGKVLGLVAGFVASVIGAYVRLQVGILKAIAQAVSRTVSGFASIVSAGASGAARLVAAVARGLASLAGKFLGAMVAGARAVASGGAQALSAAARVASDILGAFSGLAGQMAGVGANIISSLAGGIRSMAGAAASAAASAAKSAYDAAKNFLHIGSPSKLFIGVGQEVVNGFAIGLTKSQKARMAAIGLAKVAHGSISDYIHVFGEPLGVKLSTALAQGISSRTAAIQRAVSNVMGSAVAAVRRMPAAFRDTGELVSGNFANAMLGGTDPTGPAAEQAQKFIQTLSDDYASAVQQRSDLTKKVQDQNAKISASTKKAKEIQHDLNAALAGKTTGKGKKRKTVVNKERVHDLRVQLKNTQTGIAASKKLIASYNAQIKTINQSKLMSAKVRAQASNAVIAGAAVLDALGAQRSALADKIDKANQDLQNAMEARANFAASVRDTIRNFGSLLSIKAPEAQDPAPQAVDAAKLVESATTRLNRVTALYGAQSQQAAAAARDLAAAQQHQADVAKMLADQQTKANEATSISAADLVKGLQDRLATTKAFISTIQQLRAAGLNDAALQELVSAGPEQAGDYAKAILAGGQAAISAINDTQSQMDKLAQSFGDQTSHWFYDAGVKAAQGILDGLKSQDAALAAQMKAIADGIVKQVKRALGIKSPSRVMRDLFAEVPAGAVLGIASGVSDVQRQSRALAEAALMHGSAWSGRVGDLFTPLRGAVMSSMPTGAPQVVHNEPHYNLTAITEARPGAIMDQFAWEARVGRLAG